MANVLYQCPRTGMQVQAWMQEESATIPGKSIELVHCPACTQLHFVDRRTGKLFEDRNKK